MTPSFLEIAMCITCAVLSCGVMLVTPRLVNQRIDDGSPKMPPSSSAHSAEGEGASCPPQIDAIPYRMDGGYLLASVGMVVLAVASMVVATQLEGSTIELIEVLACVLALMVAAVYDAKLHIIPNFVSVALILVRLAILAYVFLATEDAVLYVVDSVLAFALSFTVLSIAGRLSRGGVGAGDVKLLAAVGFIGGTYRVMYVMFFSLVACALVSVPLLLSKRKSKSDVLPFAPFVYVGFTVSILLSAFV